MKHVRDILIQTIKPRDELLIFNRPVNVSVYKFDEDDYYAVLEEFHVSGAGHSITATTDEVIECLEWMYRELIDADEDKLGDLPLYEKRLFEKLLDKSAEREV